MLWSVLKRKHRQALLTGGEFSMSDYCKVIEKYKKCQCCQSDNQDGLASQIHVPRPTERVIEREIVELATTCEDCGCSNIKPNGVEYENAN